MSEDKQIIQQFTSGEYKEGFVTDVEQEFIPKGLNEDIVRMISARKGEPQWLLEFRLDALRKWQAMPQPDWAHLDMPEIDFQDIIYFAAPKKDKDRPKEIDPKLAETFDKLGIPLKERDVLAGVVAVDAVFDSVSVVTTFKEELAKAGVIFCSISEAIREHPLLLAHGTAGAKDEEAAFCASARVMDQVYARRRALKEGKRAPAVKGELEWVVAATPDRGGICLLMVNTKSEPQRVRVSVKGRQTAAPTYRTLSCPERFLDCREVPGDGKPWTQLSWEDTQTGFEGIPMSPYENLAPAAGALEIEIAPHTVQSVSFRVRKAK